MASLQPQLGEPFPHRATLTPAGESLASYDHSRRRVFIGPMLEKEASNTDIYSDNRKLTQQIESWLHSSAEGLNEDEESFISVLLRHAFQDFLRQDGRQEDWGQQTETVVRQGIWKRWQESEWGGSLKHRRRDAHATTQRWVGGSFEVGNVLGVNILDNPTASLPHANHTGSNDQPDGPSTAEHPFVASGQSARADVFVSPTNSHAPPSESSTQEVLRESSNSSSTVLINAGVAPEHHRSSRGTLLEDDQPPILKSDKSSTQTGMNKRKASFFHGGRVITPSDLRTPSGLDKGKNRSLDHAIQGTAEVDDVPAPPAAVLARSGSDVYETSAGVTLERTPSREEVRPEDIILRDRMLVRVSYTKSESLPRHFDEVQNRMTADIKFEDWAEFLVVWRGKRLEIYEDYTLPGKEYITGHKHLAFIIPLRPGSTHSSLYSFTDFTFCIMCPPTPVHNGQSKARALFHRAKEGTNVFVFKAKCRTRAMDWCWQLWRHLGGQIPSSIELRCPVIGTRVSLDVPIVDAVHISRAYDMFSRRNIIDIVRNSLSSSPDSHETASRDWKHVVEPEIAAGKTLELAWRVDAKLDWVWQEEDVMGQPRPWAVLCGLAMQQGSKPAHLELRLGQHYPITIHLPDWTKLHEPPCVEGYLDRIKLNSQTRQHVYLTSHDGNLFALWPPNSHPPAPPNVHLSRILSSSNDETLEYTRSLHAAEVARGAAQIAAAFEVFDLRHISEIRRAIRENIDRDTDPTTNEAGGSMGNQGSFRDEDDVGGAEGLAQAHDKNQLRIGRCFEMILVSGRIIRFETYSCQTSQEWVDRLRALVVYWTKRHRADAQDEMEISYSTNHRSRITPRVNKHAFCGGHEIPTTPMLDTKFMPELSSLYHWCTLGNCRSIIKSGRAFIRKGLHGQYKLVQLFLVSGRLVQYNVSRNSFLRQRSKEINLVDSYVCSGYLAALALRSSEYNPQTPSVARRYSDGFEVDDPEEDMLFTIWYRRTSAGAADYVPSLSSKHKLAVFRTRSRVERDAWCWALGCEIEKLVRANKYREAKFRDAGGLVELADLTH
ncbi:hypothetical protein AZE42_01293 [Rhizopogon vesiculosus]|uniref:Mug56/Spo71 PH domain-containing protein n=1 Tax=Rhizopogon vesiculosus TaxID=180088 RepID=A0A1J8QAI5_9AGAM|nr:hypothetical protein AZE42_01293 [Rhizopogon vesiculosus]